METATTLEIGDRVNIRGSDSTTCGTVTQVLHDGFVRVLWDSAERGALQFGERLGRLMPEMPARNSEERIGPLASC
jgi:hypothetical protein